MTSSYSVSQTFTQTHAKYLASKVVADLYQCHRFYGQPSESAITEYHDELVIMLAGGYVKEYEFGFKQNGQRVVSWQYRVSASGDLMGGTDDRSGGIYARASVTGAVFFNFMSYNDVWFGLTDVQKSNVQAQHAINRTTGKPPADGSGYWQTERSYSNGGVEIARRNFRPL